MTEKIKVCIMLPIHFSSRMGGAEYQARLLTDALCCYNKYDLYYLCRRADKNFIPQGYQIRVVNNSSSNRFFPFSEMLELYKELKKIKPSIIYQNVGGFQTGVAGYYAKKHGAKFIWHIASDDDIAPQWKSNIKRTLRDLPQRNILNYGIKHATLIAAQTRYQADLLKIKFGISSQGIIPIGHPFPEEVPFKTKPLTVLWIANLKPLKRPEIFVRLARYFRERGDVRFVMIGRRGWGKWFEQMQIDIQDLPQLDYVGELAQDQVNHYLSRGHILVNTSRYEGFSNTFVQAWIRKVPVVSLTVDPDQVLVKENIGFKSETFEKLCQDVKTLIDDAAMRERMGEKALHYARNNHSIQKMVFSANRLIDSLIPPYS